VTVAALTTGVYFGAIVLGLRVKTLDLFRDPPGRALAWMPPAHSTIPAGPLGESIDRGRRIFEDTAVYLPQFTRSKVSCGSCHAAGGIQPYASPMVGLPALFPMYNKRAGHVISLRDRIEECFVRSENGKPLAYDSREMQAIVDYIGWLSTPEPARLPFVGRGLVSLPDLKPDAGRGEVLYAQQCAGCHGVDGQGTGPLFPPVWGPGSFNDGAGMNDVQKMAAFVQHNMPQNRMGNLTAQEAVDVAAYIHARPRPQFDPAYRNF
jgi:thiosulfate dehydrogenase